MVLKYKTNEMNIDETTYILIPKQIRGDSQYPFKDEDILIIEVVDGKLIIQKEEMENEKD